MEIEYKFPQQFVYSVPLKFLSLNTATNCMLTVTTNFTMHIPYEIKLGHIADFKVEYRFYSKAEGGRETIPFQGYRSDFWYEHVGNVTNSIFMIWPEFENEIGEVIIESEILNAGVARMWVINPQRRNYHKDKIKLGMTGYFMEASRKVAECKVIEILGLHDNPVT